jgi:hypothetical protein
MTATGDAPGRARDRRDHLAGAAIAPHRAINQEDHDALAAMIVSSRVSIGCGTAIRPGQRGVAYKASAGCSTMSGEGYFRWPWNDFVRYDVTWQSKTEEIEILWPTRCTCEPG